MLRLVDRSTACCGKRPLTYLFVVFVAEQPVRPKHHRRACGASMCDAEVYTLLLRRSWATAIAVIPSRNRGAHSDLATSCLRFARLGSGAYCALLSPKEKKPVLFGISEARCLDISRLEWVRARGKTGTRRSTVAHVWPCRGRTNRHRADFPSSHPDFWTALSQ